MIKMLGYEPFCTTAPGDTFTFEHDGIAYTAEMWCTDHASGLDCYVDGSPAPDPVDDLFDVLWRFREALNEEEARFGIETLRKQALSAAIQKFNAKEG